MLLPFVAMLQVYSNEPIPSNLLWLLKSGRPFRWLAIQLEPGESKWRILCQLQ
ncbi:hypothetical protein SAMN02927914_01028 [Mesorhizobium qingshengii]|uniref:Uncharacterized protein n=1 Tax=Mesorhizobium qingshengii TaxID=1165689 RepID=A0A1G5W0U2_9HYPH|nr:hypothetical protein SAMN02927914_01028 [Mesorhizobium qingshengii]